MLYVVETAKEFDRAVADLEEAVKRRQYGVLHVHDIQKTLKGKGIDFPNKVRILEVCNPQRAMRVLTAHMPVNLALPCRLSVFEEEGRVKIGMIKPTFLLSIFPHSDDLKAEAEAVERDTIGMIEETR